MVTVDITKLYGNIEKYFNLAEEGETIRVKRQGKVVAEIKAPILDKEGEDSDIRPLGYEELSLSEAIVSEEEKVYK